MDERRCAPNNRRRSSDDASRASSRLGGFSKLTLDEFIKLYPEVTLAINGSMHLPSLLSLDDDPGLQRLVQDAALGIVTTGEIMAIINEKYMCFFCLPAAAIRRQAQRRIR
jgi:hypothetical protein